jgi:hypothetical protein
VKIALSSLYIDLQKIDFNQKNYGLKDFLDFLCVLVYGFLCSPGPAAENKAHLNSNQKAVVGFLYSR